MCCILSKHFIGIFLFLCMIRYDTSYITAYSNPLNNSEEIKNIFRPSGVEGAPGTGNYAEGGLININLTLSTPNTSIKDVTKTSFSNKSASLDIIKKENVSSFTTTIFGNSKSNNSTLESPTVRNLMPTKLTETGSNLFLGVPEVIHINGTSSIKPRKGVHYNKIVPRKGVDNENESSHEFLESDSCFKLTEKECYNATGWNGVECNCCKEGNVLGKIVKKQVVVNCKNCKPLNVLSPGKEICKNICCTAVVHDMYSGSTTHDISSKYLNYETLKENKNENSFGTENNSTKKIVTEKKDAVVNSKKNSKLKPSLTKVPYDVEVVTEIFSKTQQKIFVPIIVSIFLLPLIGILLLFLWRRTKEYWDKRYYKRMDFLIDGIYND